MKGQLSAEMLILITVILAIVAIAAYQLLNQARTAASSINQTAGTIMGQTQVCQSDSDCASLNCPSGTQKCNLGVCECV